MLEEKGHLFFEAECGTFEINWPRRSERCLCRVLTYKLRDIRGYYATEGSECDQQNLKLNF